MSKIDVKVNPELWKYLRTNCMDRGDAPAHFARSQIRSFLLDIHSGLSAVIRDGDSHIYFYNGWTLAYLAEEKGNYDDDCESGSGITRLDRIVRRVKEFRRRMRSLGYAFVSALESSTDGEGIDALEFMVTKPFATVAEFEEGVREMIEAYTEV